MNVTGNIIYDLLLVAGCIALAAIAVEVFLAIRNRKKALDEVEKHTEDTQGDDDEDAADC